MPAARLVTDSSLEQFYDPTAKTLPGRMPNRYASPAAIIIEYFGK
jgi:hypothetical protein